MSIEATSFVPLVELVDERRAQEGPTQPIGVRDQVRRILQPRPQLSVMSYTTSARAAEAATACISSFGICDRKLTRAALLRLTPGLGLTYHEIRQLTGHVRVTR